MINEYMNDQDLTDKSPQSLTFPRGRQHDVCRGRNRGDQLTLFTNWQITYLKVFLPHALEKKMLTLLSSEECGENQRQ